VFDPQAGTDGETLDVDGRSTNGESGAPVGRRDTASSTGQARVPLSQILAEYQQRATAASEQADLSPAARALVRAYFDRLAER
jgi:hypothetical protein